MKKLYIGTSGWAYGHWDNIFYPEGISSKEKLRYFSRYFKTVEVNYSFYHLPRPATYQNWRRETPAGFIFSVKASRFITHIKRLKEAGSAWEGFLKNALNLKEKLGPILFQLPPSFQATDVNLKRLDGFLKLIGDTGKRERGFRARYAFEFRHNSWLNKGLYSRLKKYNAAWVIADSPHYPRADVITADFVYLRLHGSKAMFSSKYTKKELRNLSDKIKKWITLSDVYVYFNNDAMGYALENARDLISLCQ